MKNSLEERIAEFMLTAAKFEFLLVTHDIGFAHVGKDEAVGSINWCKVALSLEHKHAFWSFNFDRSGFLIFKEQVPQKLYWSQVADKGELKWDNRNNEVGSWKLLLSESYAQFRNNIAHGNKGLHSPFTSDRTLNFIDAGYALTSFIAVELFGKEHWEDEIIFH